MKNITKDMEKFQNSSCLSSGRTYHLTAPIANETLPPQSEELGCQQANPGGVRPAAQHQRR